MSTIKQYVLVDDDPINNAISKMVIKSVVGDADIRAFLSPQEGLTFFRGGSDLGSNEAILLLDINMSPDTGWDFMEEFQTFSETLKEQLNIYILSSSVDSRDMEKAASYKDIKGFLSKPLRKDVVQSLISAL